MKRSFVRTGILILAAACPAGLFLATACHAQQASSPDKVQQLNGRETMQRLLEVERAEEVAYKTFDDVKPEDTEKKIKLGQDFLQRYPKSQYAGAVNVGLTNAYYAQQDWKNFYASADRALALKPGEVDVLITVGWVIPHLYDPNDADAGKQLDKAETYEKQAMQVMATMVRPPRLTQSQFAEFKAQKSIQAHSALGLVYFRRSDYENSAQELLQATQNNATPDQTDLFVLGASLGNLNRYAEAAEAFDRCGQIAGDLQDQCKQNAAGAKKQAAQSQSK
jgi:tetratricopeptide (TPR) repeat protein